MSDWFDSEEKMARFARTNWIVATAGYTIGLISWPITLLVAVPCAIIATTAVLLATFSSFRREHLREIERERQNPYVR